MRMGGLLWATMGGNIWVIMVDYYGVTADIAWFLKVGWDVVKEIWKSVIPTRNSLV